MSLILVTIVAISLVLLSTLPTNSVIFAFIFGLYCSVENSKKEKNKIYEQGYLDACKDFYKGKLKYDLVEHNDGTRTWEKVKETINE